MANIQIVGYLGGDPEIRTVGDNIVAEFSVAESQYEGRDREKTTGWYNCKSWGAQAEFADQYLRKGMQVTVFGQLKQRKYERKTDGSEATSLDVTVGQLFLPPKERSQDDERAEPQARGRQQQAPAPRSAGRQPQEDRQQRPAPRREPVAAGRGRTQREDYDNELDDVPF